MVANQPASAVCRDRAALEALAFPHGMITVAVHPGVPDDEFSLGVIYDDIGVFAYGKRAFLF